MTECTTIKLMLGNWNPPTCSLNSYFFWLVEVVKIGLDSWTSEVANASLTNSVISIP